MTSCSHFLRTVVLEFTKARNAVNEPRIHALEKEHYAETPWNTESARPRCRLHILSLFYAEQFKAIIANLPLHQLLKFLCERAVQDPGEVHGTLLWSEEGRIALLDCIA